MPKKLADINKQLPYVGPSLLLSYKSFYSFLTAMDDDSDLTASDDDQSNDVDAVSTPVIEAVGPPQIKCNTKRVIKKKTTPPAT